MVVFLLFIVAGNSRLFLFHKSSELTLIIADKIFSEKSLPETINHPTFGPLSIDRQMIDYPIIYE